MMLPLAWLALPIAAGIAPGGQEGAERLEWFIARLTAPGEVRDTRSSGAGRADFDVGTTALAVLLHASRARVAPEVMRATDWVLAQQDPATGVIGVLGHESARLQHALATLAVCDVLYFLSRGDGEAPAGVREAATRAVEAIVSARNVDGGWGEAAAAPSNAFLTGWMLYALVAARDAGLAVDTEVLAGGLAWLARRTDPETGRVAYGEAGTRDPLGVGATEIMTAQALLLRILIASPPKDDPLTARQADRLAAAAPAMDDASFRADPTYWLFGSLALYRVGGRHWRAWSRAMKGTVLVASERPVDDPEGGKPRGVLGPAAGRVGEAALTYLATEVYFRYAAFAGAR